MRVVQITDTHIKADPGDLAVIEWFGGVTLHDPADTLAFVLADIAALEQAPDLIVATGDLADRGHPAAYRRLNAMLNELNVPTVVLPGNHDLADELDAHLPGGHVELATTRELGGWTFAFGRTGNTEWGELGSSQLAALDAQLATRNNEPVFVWMHHPPRNLMGPHGPSAPFLGEDLAWLHERHRVTGVAAGHVHGAHDLVVDGIGVHASPSTFMGAGGPGYRIVDFDADGAYRTSVRSWPERSTMTDEKRDTLVANITKRNATVDHGPIEREHEEHAIDTVRQWRAEADERRGHAIVV